MKKIAVISKEFEPGEIFGKNLKDVFGESISIEVYSMKYNVVEFITADIVLITTFHAYDQLKGRISNNAKIVHAHLTYQRTGIEKIKDLPENTKAMLVNLSEEMAIESISKLYSLGINNIDFSPMYPRKEPNRDIKIAITPDEMHHVPDYIENAINIGYRVLDINAIIEVAQKLNYSHIIKSDAFKSYYNFVALNKQSIEDYLERSIVLQKQLATLVASIHRGFIAINFAGNIVEIDEFALSVLNMEKDFVIHKNIDKLLGLHIFSQVLYEGKYFNERVFKVHHKNFVISAFPIKDDNKEIQGAFATVSTFEELEHKQTNYRKQMLGKGHVTKYSSDDIIGADKKIVEIRKLMPKMAKTKSTVMITGESGTGKELVAQSIHNLSNRSKNQFVAINCAALPKSILESELFGYEEGAFTGAKKGGKAGIFELANGGTLFLDEIGEMPLETQGQLLRVIQEREVMRLGGDKLVSVDIRLIVATNKDMIHQVKNNLFRKDLYYRLNVIPIHLPSLRERKGDITLLIKHYIDKLGYRYNISDEAMTMLSNADWEGNVREIINCVEYLEYVGKDQIYPHDLPMYITKKDTHEDRQEEKSNLRTKEDIDIKILKILKEAYKNKQRMGRKSIAEKLQSEDIYITEAQVRHYIVQLETKGLVIVNVGRSGTTLTKEAMNYLDNL